MSPDFYDQFGNPIGYTDDGEHIYLFSGLPVGYLHAESVYSYPGRHLGRLENGLVRDHEGAVAFFTPGSSGGPLKPVKQLKSLKGIKQIRPIRGVRQIRPIKPVNLLSWSPLSSEAFFYQ
jgi:hypothetical protein